MRVLSIKQPWATLIVRGVKRFEARNWQTPHRGTIAVHASSGTAPFLFEHADDDEVLGSVLCSQGWGQLGDLKSLPRTAVVGTVDIVKIVPASEIWESLTPVDRVLVGSFDEPPENLYLWELANPREIAPVSVNGKLNLWTLPDDITGRVALECSKPVATAGSSIAASAVLEAQRVRTQRLADRAAEDERYLATRVRLLSPLSDLLGFDTATQGEVNDAMVAFIKPLVQGPDGQVTVTPALQKLFKRKRRTVTFRDISEAATALLEELD